ncbi:MAG TPA: DUF3047 domain-containing protein [bacterium]|nr:DUF3047 domain-containing protein [bacterium]
MRLDDFARTLAPGATPGKWQVQKISPFFGEGNDQFFQFVNGAGPDDHYIHLRSGSDNSFSVGLRDGFRLQNWPILEWQWKVTKTPKGGDVRVQARDDQAGSMCVIVNPGLIGFDSLCYLWENDGPKDTPITSTKRDASRYLILRTVKADGIGRWYSERRNILQDYTRVFGHPPEKEAVIGMQIDSDSTKSSAEAFYRDIYLRKR